MRSYSCFPSSLFWILIVTSKCLSPLNAFQPSVSMSETRKESFQLKMRDPTDHDKTFKKDPPTSGLSRRRLLMSPKVIFPSLLAGASKTRLQPSPSLAFDGGVGGLGKTKPSTGVVFRDPDSSQSAFSTSESDFSNELITPDGTPVLVSFDAPWPLLRSSSSIESRAISAPDSAFVLVAPFTSSSTSMKGDEKVFKKSFFVDNVFESAGKYGEYVVLIIIIEPTGFSS